MRRTTKDLARTVLSLKTTVHVASCDSDEARNVVKQLLSFDLCLGMTSSRDIKRFVLIRAFLLKHWGNARRQKCGESDSQINIIQFVHMPLYHNRQCSRSVLEKEALVPVPLAPR
jgi:hypothetical protein